MNKWMLAFLSCSSHMDRISGRYHSFSDHINAPWIIQSNNHNTADFYWISISPLPQARLSLGGRRWWREGLTFCLIPFPSLLLTLTHPHTKSYLALDGRKVILAWRVEIWYSRHLGGTYSKCQFIFLGVLFVGGLGELHYGDLSLAILLAQASLFWLLPHLSPAFLWSLHTLLQVVLIGTAPLNQIRIASYQKEPKSGLLTHIFSPTKLWKSRFCL